MVLIVIMLMAAVPCADSMAAPVLPVVRHALTIQFDIARKWISVDDELILPAEWGRGKTLHFVLDAGLTPRITGAHAQLKALSDDRADRPLTKSYLLKAESPGTPVTIHYEGILSTDSSRESRDIRELQVEPGSISDQGIYLDPDALWYPQFDAAHVIFTLEMHLPAGWDAVSQGRRVRHEQSAQGPVVVWKSDAAQEGIFAVAAPFTEYQRSSGALRLYAFLRKPDSGLATSYLDSAAEDIALFEKLLGPYPYKKFALVENYWQSGLGMPSFTLLGSEIIRLPFIRTSSFPHEILHNWLGNGVFVDYKTGNWSEGLTSYLADHGFQEMIGKGSEYRRGVLQKYTDYVSSDRDFPLSEFTSRFSPASEAVGYGKTLMFFHMLRQRMGDEAFIAALRKFVRDDLFRPAGFVDLRAAFSAVTGWDLSADFAQWVERRGAPRLRLTSANSRPAGGGYRLDVHIEQIQEGAPFRIVVPIAVTLDGVAEALETSVLMDGHDLTEKIATAERPLRVDIDPEFDVFRLLNDDERPPSVGELLGAEKLVMVRTGKDSGQLRAYTEFADQLRRRNRTQIESVVDADLKESDDSDPLWLVGANNRWTTRIMGYIQSQGATLENGYFEVNGRRYALDRYAVVIVARSEAPRTRTLMWTAAPDEDSRENLLRKLPHYGKYSYLVFDNKTGTNVEKGSWLPASTSMVRAVRYPDGPVKLPARAGLQKRPALLDTAHTRGDNAS